MTLQDLKSMDRAIITPAVAAKVLNCDPQYIRVAARQCPEQLGFPVIIMGTRTRIPRIAFIRFLEGGYGE